MSDIIHLLPDSIANQIAAGEVIQRPASVVKELVENAVDAGAGHIQVNIKDAGRTLVQVIDDGKGMSETDARMAFERHATSKISTADDLFSLHTMGFRGEALASIVAVSQVELRTRLKGAELGTHLVFSGSELESVEPDACTEGSIFSVKNLFFNVPARRKFLKSNETEFRNIINEFERIALVNSQVALSLYHNDTEIFNLPESGLRQRIVNVYGKTLNQKLLSVDAQSSLVTISGFVGRPDSAKKRGLYSISLPEKLEQKLLRRSGKNDWLPLLTGVLVVVMSTPCTAPYLGTTIGFALAGSTLDIFINLLAVALGLSVPYLLVCFMPDITAFIPKPGPWMNKLNTVMRIMLLLTMVWLFSILWAQTEAWTCIRLAVYLCLFLLLVWFRYLLLNQIAVSELEAEVKNGVVRLIGLGFVLLSVLIVVGSSWDVTHSFYRQREQEIQTKTRQIDFTEIAADVRAGKTVIVNVGADWCLTCTYNDKLVFGNIGVKNLLDRYNVKMINVDWTNYSAEILNFMSRYGRRGIPFYILFSPNIPEGMVLPEIMTEKDFREIIQNVAG